MNLTKRLKSARAEAKLSQLIPYTHLNSATVFECKTGAPGSVIQVEGIPFITEENNALNHKNAQWHQALTLLDERFIQYVTLHRKKVKPNLEGHFSSYFAEKMNEKYQSHLKQKALFSNAIYLTTLLKGDNSTKAAQGMNAFNRITQYLNPKAMRSLHREKQMETLATIISQLTSQLSSFNPKVLGSQDGLQGESELLRFLALLVNANETIAFRHPTYNAPIAASIPQTHRLETRYPQGHLGQYLCAKGMYFGDTIQFQGATPTDCRFGIVLSVKKYGLETGHIMLDPLYELPCELIATHSFAPLSRDKALKEITLKRNKLINASDLGVSQIDELTLLEDHIACEQARLGYHHNTILLLADNIEELNEYVLEAMKSYAQCGMVLVRETLGLEPAFFAQLPGNHHLIARASLITSHNFTDFCSLHNQPTGFKQGNHLNGPVTLLETPAKTPVYFNFHTRGGTLTNPAPGHTAVFGATNAGKNTLIAFLDSQLERFNHRSFFLDRNEAAKLYVLSHEKSCYTVISPKTETLAMNPFQLPDSKENRAFLKVMMAELVKRPDEDNVPSSITELLNECVNYAYDSLDKSYRQLTHIVKTLPRQFERWPELRRFLRTDGLQEEGEFAWIFDNPNDSLDFDFDKIGFDITYLMDELSVLIATPIYLYLLHRLRQCFDGRLTAIVMDEAWQILNSPFWEKALNTDLPTIRKLNAFFIFMTQSPETVLTSAIASIILANVVTTLIFPNEGADRETYQRGLGLTEAEYQIVKHTNPLSRHFLYRQRGEQSMVCRLDLSALTDEIRVFSGNKQTVDLFDQLVQETGFTPKNWLPVFYARSAR